MTDETRRRAVVVHWCYCRCAARARHATEACGGSAKAAQACFSRADVAVVCKPTVVVLSSAALSRHRFVLCTSPSPSPSRSLCCSPARRGPCSAQECGPAALKCGFGGAAPPACWRARAPQAPAWTWMTGRRSRRRPLMMRRLAAARTMSSRGHPPGVGPAPSRSLAPRWPASRLSLRRRRAPGASGQRGALAAAQRDGC